MLGGGYVIGTTNAGDSGKVVATSSLPLSSGTWEIHAEVVAGAVTGDTRTVTATATYATVAP